MAETIYTVDVIQMAGQLLVSTPALFGARILYVTREGIGMTEKTDLIPTGPREFVFKTSGLFAYKLRFYDTDVMDRNIHVIYKLI